MKPRVPSSPSAISGFTLVEMIVVIVLMGIVAGMVAVFIRSPITAYVDTNRRAQLTAAADTALRFFARDLRSALPNSVRVTLAGGVQYLEFVPTVGGARYRQYPTAAGGGNVLDFTLADTSFDLLGAVPAYTNAHFAVVFNTDADASPSSVYSGGNRAALTSSGVTPVAMAATRFPAPSPAARVHFVTTPVSYACNLATGQLLRFEGYAFSAVQPAPPAGGTVSVLAENLTACSFTYNPSVTTMRTGLVVLNLSLTQAGENIRLVHQVHVQNMP